jgi:hypothetical protein
MIRQSTVTVAAAGSNGSAVGSGQAGPINGRVVAVHLAYTNAPATTDVILSGANAPSMPVLTLSNANSNRWVFPLNQAQNVASGADFTGQVMPVFLNDYVKLDVAQADSNTVITATVVYDS